MKLPQVLIILLSLTAIFSRKSHSKNFFDKLKRFLKLTTLKEDVQKSTFKTKTDMEICTHVAVDLDKRLAKIKCKINCAEHGIAIGQALRDAYIPKAINDINADPPKFTPKMISSNQTSIRILNPTRKNDFETELAEMVAEKMNYLTCTKRKRHRKH